MDNCRAFVREVTKLRQFALFACRGSLAWRVGEPFCGKRRCPAFARIGVGNEGRADEMISRFCAQFVSAPRSLLRPSHKGAAQEKHPAILDGVKFGRKRRQRERREANHDMIRSIKV